MAKIGRPKHFNSPQELWDWYQAYRQDILDNPILLQKWVGKEAVEVQSKHYKPPTWAGFEAFLFKKGLGAGRCGYINLDWYRRNHNNAYNEFQGMVRAIGRDMFDRKFSGASVGEYQYNIISRELGLADVQEINNNIRPILERGKELPGDKELPPINDILLE